MSLINPAYFNLFGKPGGFRTSRRFVCTMNGIRYISDDDVVFQRRKYSCGLACLQMLLRDRGIEYDIENEYLDSKEMSMLDMVNILEKYHIRCNGARYPTLDELRKAFNNDPQSRAVVILNIEKLFPYRLIVFISCILRRVLGIDIPVYRHWLVVNNVDSSWIQLRDPSLGLIEMRNKRFSDLWSGYVVVTRDPSESILNKKNTIDTDKEIDIQTPQAQVDEHGSLDAAVENVSYVYENKVIAVRQLNLQLFNGEIFCLLGPNGAGKTTLLKIMTGVLSPTSGRVILDGMEIWKASEKERAALRSSIGYMPESPFLYDRLTPREHLAFIAELCGVSNHATIAERISLNLKALHLQDKADMPIRDLSHGMRRKVAFIATQLHEPKLLLLDEPTLGLDPTSTHQLKNRLREIRSNGRTVMMTTHITEVAERLADRIGIIDRGKLLFVGTLDNLRDTVHKPEASLEHLFIILTEAHARKTLKTNPISGA